MFISIEGIHGVGKTTLANNIKNELINNNQKTEVINTPYNKNIKNMIEHEKISNHALPYLLLGDLINTFETTIYPLLKKDYTVICDEYIYSIYVIFFIAQKPDIIQHVERVNFASISQQTLPRPNITFILDSSVETAKERFRNKNKPITAPEYIWDMRRTGFLSLNDSFPWCKSYIIESDGKTQEDVLKEAKKIINTVKE